MRTLILLLFPILSFCQADSIFVDHTHQISAKSKETIVAGLAQPGDTIKCFYTNAALKIGYDTVVRADAQVIAIVKTSTTEHKVPKAERDLSQGFIQMYSGGQLEVEFIGVEAVDGSIIPLGDCSLLRYGGDNGGLPRGVPASLPVGTSKTCSIKWPGRMIKLR